MTQTIQTKTFQMNHSNQIKKRKKRYNFWSKNASPKYYSEDKNSYRRNLSRKISIITWKFFIFMQFQLDQNLVSFAALSFLSSCLILIILQEIYKCIFYRISPRVEYYMPACPNFDSFRTGFPGQRTRAYGVVDIDNFKKQLITPLYVKLSSIKSI